MPRSAVPAKAQRKDTKRVNWAVIPNKRLNKSIYVSDEMKNVASLDEETEEDMLRLFSNKPPPRVKVDGEEGDGEDGDGDGSGGGDEKKKKAGPKTVGILDQKRMTNILIMLRKFECNVQDIVDAVCSLDPRGDMLTYDNVSALWENGFKPEELEIAKGLTLPDEELKEMSPAEVLPYYIARTPRWAEKIKALMTIRTADEVQMEIRQSISVVTAASSGVIESKRFKRVLAMVLVVGNFLNAGTAKGDLRGFKLESLNRLNEIKAQKPGQNLLHFITDLMHKKDEDALLFMDDFKSCEKAERVTKEDIAKELGSFQKAVAVTQKEVESIMKDNGFDEKKLEAQFGQWVKDVEQRDVDSRSKDGEKDDSGGGGGGEGEDGEDSEERKKERAKNREEEAKMDKKDVIGRRMLLVKHRMNRSSKAVGELVALQTEMLAKFTLVTTALGEEPKNAKVEEFFGALNKFVDVFRQSLKDNTDRREEELRQQRLEKRRAEDREKRELAQKKKEELARQATKDKDQSKKDLSLPILNKKDSKNSDEDVLRAIADGTGRENDKNDSNDDAGDIRTPWKHRTVR